MLNFTYTASESCIGDRTKNGSSVTNIIHVMMLLIFFFLEKTRGTDAKIRIRCVRKKAKGEVDGAVTITVGVMSKA